MTVEKLIPIEFDELTHTYVVEGRVLPSVTQVMKRLSEDSYAQIPQSIMDVASSRGTKVHKAIDEYLKFGIEPIEDDVKAYFKGFMNAIRELGIKVLNSEMILTNGVYCGTVDAIVEYKEKVYLIDWKTTSKINENLVSVQFAGYKELCEWNGIKVDACMVVQLNNKTPSGYRHRAIKPDHFTWQLLLDDY